MAQAIAARMAWHKDHPQTRRYRYGRESEPCWHQVAWARYEWCILRDFSEEMLRRAG